MWDGCCCDFDIVGLLFGVYGNYKWRLMGAGVQKPCKLYHALPLAYPPGEIAPSPMLPVYCMAGLA